MFDAVCVGHICLDFTPKFPNRNVELKDIFVPGKQSDTEEMFFTTGGSVANTGLALNIMGLNTPLIAKVGDDIIGSIIAELLTKKGGSGKYLSVSKGDYSSYSVVIAVPGNDRVFLHSPAVNDTFVAKDIDYDVIANAKLMHFGYPPLMKQMYLNEGEELVKVMKKSKELGATTSIDTAYPDPTSLCAKQNWEAILSKVLKYTDIFTPSIEEILLLLDRPYYNELKAKNEDVLLNLDVEYLPKIATRLLNMGAKIVVLKCGTLGYYVKTASDLSSIGRATPKNLDGWNNKEYFSGIYYVDNVASATGAGDTSIAGFIASLIKGYTCEEAINIACATGATCVTQVGATDAMVPFEEIAKKVADGWQKRPTTYNGNYFKYNEKAQLYYK